MICERSKITTLKRKIEQEAHHQRGTEALLARIDTTFYEERRSHPQRYVERGNETQIEPVRAFESDPFP
jgi:hypothetical protein